MGSSLFPSELENTSTDTKKSPNKLQNAENTSKFILKEMIEQKITRFGCNRQLILGMFTQGPFSHSSLWVIYFSKWNARAKQKLLSRAFRIDLFKNEKKENILYIAGPGQVIAAGYDCKELYIIVDSMNGLIDIAKETMEKHGKYDYLFNNCRHFTNTFLNNIKNEHCYAAESSDITCETLTKYLKATITDKMPSANFNNTGGYTAKDNIKCMRFDQVLREFPLENKQSWAIN
eukprot:437494_1